jgi:Flp pilus assembly pilin Flp
MLNLVEKFTPEAVEATDDGVVAIEYVVTAAAIVVALAGLFALGLGGILTGALSDIVDTIPGVTL